MPPKERAKFMMVHMIVSNAVIAIFCWKFLRRNNVM